VASINPAVTDSTPDHGVVDVVQTREYQLTELTVLDMNSGFGVDNLHENEGVEVMQHTRTRRTPDTVLAGKHEIGFELSAAESVMGFGLPLLLELL
jgi:hypothetical protein